MLTIVQWMTLLYSLNAPSEVGSRVCSGSELWMTLSQKEPPTQVNDSYGLTDLELQQSTAGVSCLTLPLTGCGFLGKSLAHAGQ